MRRILSVFTIALSACGTPVPITQGAQRIQVLQQSNTMVASCTKIAPIDATVDRLWPAQSVYDASVWEAKNRAAAMGADSIMILNSDQATRGLSNIITVHTVAFKCF